MFTIVKLKYGSHLYGTDTLESDLDIKGVFMPDYKDILLNKVKRSIVTNSGTDHSKNTKDDVDEEMYSFHHFMHLACDGETVALDMLHAPDNMIIEKHPIWDEIVKNRAKFYTKNLKSFVGYARNQANKYGVKGERLNTATKVFDFLINFPDFTKLNEIWDRLPEGPHITKHPKNGVIKERMYEVCGRKLGENITVVYGREIIRRLIDEYGKRAELASKNEGIDWKALSHALRACIQMREILTTGTIHFPLYNADLIKKVKAGELSYQKTVAPMLEELMSDMEEKMAKSDLPDRVDQEFWDNFMVDVIQKVVMYGSKGKFTFMK